MTNKNFKFMDDANKSYKNLRELISFTSSKKNLIKKMYEPLIVDKESVNNTLTLELKSLQKDNNILKNKISTISSENDQLKGYIKILENLLISK